MPRWLPPFLIALTAAGCASSATKARSRDEHRILRVFSNNIHYRRPTDRPADPDAYYWEKEYRADPLPPGDFDCRPVQKLLDSEKIDFPGLRGCFQSIPGGTTVSYRLDRGKLPVLALVDDDPKKTPQCLSRLLPKLPVPREIFFQSNEEGLLSCYSSRVDEDTGVMADLGPLLRTNKLALRIEFPLEHFPRTDEETFWQLAAWALAPFRGEQGRMLSRIMPDHLCQQCIGEKNLVKAWESAPKTWLESESPQNLTQ